MANLKSIALAAGLSIALTAATASFAAAADTKAAPAKPAVQTTAKPAAKPVVKKKVVKKAPAKPAAAVPQKPATEAVTPPAPPTTPVKQATTPALAAIDEDKIIQRIREMYVCPNININMVEAEAQNADCSMGYRLLETVRRFIRGTATEDDLLTIAKLFPQGQPIVADNGQQSCEVPGKLKLDFFIMSYCPYGVRFVDNLLNALVGEFGDKIDWTPYYIVYKQGDNMASMHGQKELDEDFRQVCIREKWGSKKWLEYMQC
ncbi:MAG TPA: hypothetical protein PLQ76_10085, partial [bacterium]|nr:hypothetical protein [bacterium]